MEEKKYLKLSPVEVEEAISDYLHAKGYKVKSAACAFDPIYPEVNQKNVQFPLTSVVVEVEKNPSVGD